MAFQSVSNTSPTERPRRATAPGARAIAGGALVTCAMLGVLVAPGGADEARRTYLVAGTDLAPGEPIDPDTIESAPMQLPPEIAGHAVTDPGAVEDTIARTAIPAGSVLHTGQLRERVGAGRTGPELTITVPQRRALGGQLAVGDAIDLVATYGSGTEGFSELVATGVTVTGVASTRDALGVDAGVTVTVRLAEDGPVLPVVHATHADAVSLVRRDAPGLVGSDVAFRPSPPDAEGR
jgi:hypothetical protein